MHLDERVRALGEGTERGDDERTHADVRHEVAVHDVDVQPAHARRERVLHLLTEAAEIGGEDRGRDLDRGGARHVRSPRKRR